MSSLNVLCLSHPVWVRGLKHKNFRDIGVLNKVAPRVGAWIETYQISLEESESGVAPRVGAWIETLSFYINISTFPVAPRVGAWIETRP